jgi:hypothetical protein
MPNVLFFLFFGCLSVTWCRSKERVRVPRITIERTQRRDNINSTNCMKYIFPSVIPVVIF